MTILDLISKGLLKEGDTLVWKRRSLGETHTAIVQANGNLVTEDGAVHKTPSGAAKHFGNKPVDGWNTWKIGQSKTSIGSLIPLGLLQRITLLIIRVNSEEHLQDVHPMFQSMSHSQAFQLSQILAIRDLSFHLAVENQISLTQKTQTHKSSLSISSHLRNWEH